MWYILSIRVPEDLQKQLNAMPGRPELRPAIASGNYYVSGCCHSTRCSNDISEKYLESRVSIPLQLPIFLEIWDSQTRKKRTKTKKEK